MIFDVAIIGAGLSGLSAARHLTEQGLRVVIVEKSHGVSGRASTRRTQLPDGTGLVIDHGAQFFTARDPLFQSQVSAWLSEEICFQWATGFHTWDGNSLHPPDFKWDEPRYACHAGMSSLGNHLASGLEIFKSFTVSEVLRETGEWVLHCGKANMEPVRAKSLFCSAPVPQSLRLVGSYLSASERERLEKISYGPCFAVMACYKDLLVDAEWKGIQIRDTHSPLSWIACDSSRRGPDQSQGTLVIHASPDFSSIEKLSSQEEKEKATAQILSETARILGDWAGRPFHTITHHWHYSISLSEGLPEGFLRSENESSIYLIGDGLKRGRVEGAWLSGLEGAKHYISSL